ncbi:FKBP-type peptidyl-prolyl cis-trans isomerase [Cryobacterium sp. PH31-O1]|uniref:FKBP-type peptidyl-prolyl cis-trans isomerase n=1 Tax=Cryobacterium sp. PH31-O1 TaxID=3046306 RepID=UPI0024BAF81C|nr:FKBP-type peptidyl-prolyl cis-trans isomerase [Cryobacterium sp. PH31-O1]MDJ0336824.1 FKBP-type peptidyl-prolyl cis-trans isomerase [Cryobacterium sp. PH31-O1]
MRKASALIITAGLVMTALTACASPGSAQASCDSTTTAGAATDLVSVTGDLGTAPDVNFPTPLKSATTQRSEIIAGSGEKIVAGQLISAEINIYNGTNGNVIAQGAYDEANAPLFLLNGADISGITDGLLCARVGERAVIVVAPEDGLAGTDTLPAGVAPTDTLVVVVDVVKAFLPRANGVDQTVANGLPAVVLDENGVPGIVVPGGDAPTTLEVGVLKKGAGEKIEEDSNVLVNLIGVLWKDKTVLSSTWSDGSPTQLVPNGVIKGLGTSLIGQTVGSQIVAVIPPDQGYGATATDTIPAESTLVFVVDILGVN